MTSFAEIFIRSMPPKRKWFTLTVRPETLRGMNRAQYKEVSRWLRTTERILAEKIRRIYG